MKKFPSAMEIVYQNNAVDTEQSISQLSGPPVVSVDLDMVDGVQLFEIPQEQPTKVRDTKFGLCLTGVSPGGMRVTVRLRFDDVAIISRRINLDMYEALELGIDLLWRLNLYDCETYEKMASALQKAKGEQ